MSYRIGKTCSTNFSNLLEYSDSSRAKCNGPACSKEGNKIQKGEIRIGTFVDTGQFASFRWRHWYLNQ